jgi:hypothetical protein
VFSGGKAEMPTQVTTKTIEERDDDDPAVEYQVTPLFDRSSSKKTKTITRISVRRTDPEEGHLGILGADATEHEIFQKWGGGEFDVKAKNDAGQVVTQMILRIAGDPVFQSEIAEARWRRANNLRPSTARPEGGGIREILTVIEEREARRREEERERRTAERQEGLDREERNRREQREHEAKIAKDSEDREERRRKDDAEREDRRRSEARADDERRARQHREDIERVEAAAKLQLAQTQQFFSQLQAMAKREEHAAGGADPIKILTTGMDLALKMREGAGDGAPADALTALLSRLPETLAEVRTTAKEAYSEVKGKRAAAAPPSSVAKGDEVTITGATATKLKKMITILTAAGGDPESVIGGLADHVIGRAAKQQAATPAPARPSARPPTAARAAPRRAGESPKKAAARRPARKK